MIKYKCGTGYHAMLLKQMLAACGMHRYTELIDLTGYNGSAHVTILCHDAELKVLKPRHHE